MFVFLPRGFFCRKIVTKGKLIHGLCVDQVYLVFKQIKGIIDRCVGFGAYICKFNITLHVTWESEIGNPNEVNLPWV